MNELCQHCGRSAIEHRKQKCRAGRIASPQSYGTLEGRKKRTVSLRNCPGFSVVDSERVIYLDHKEKEAGRKRGLKSEAMYYELRR